MAKPVNFSILYSVVTETKYTCEEPEHHGSLPKQGFLEIGRVLWLDHQPRSGESAVSCFLEGVGKIAVDPQRLMPV